MILIIIHVGRVGVIKRCFTNGSIYRFHQILHRESKKTRHQILDHNFTNYYPIFKIFSPADSAVNLQQSDVTNIPPLFKHVATLPGKI